jgi:hypothetical protein
MQKFESITVATVCCRLLVARSKQSIGSGEIAQTNLSCKDLRPIDGKEYICNPEQTNVTMNRLCVKALFLLCSSAQLLFAVRLFCL